MKQDCIVCGKEIDTETDTYFVGISLGEYWCHSCVLNEKEEIRMNKTQIGDMEHALRNRNAFYTDANDKNWNELVEKGFATKHPGWEDSMAYFRVTFEGKKALASSY